MGLQAQTALVTFYSAGCSVCWKDLAVGMTAGSGKTPYGGPIYDGPEKIVKGMAPNRFVTLRLQAGAHSFAGQNYNGLFRSHRDNPKRDLQLTLMPGRHYYVRLDEKDKGVYTVRYFRTILSEHPCSEAFNEAHQTDPLRAKGLDGKHLLEVVAAVYFPACEDPKTLATSEEQREQ
jgi:hypothetical protein